MFSILFIILVGLFDVDQKFVIAETRDPQTACNAKRLEDRGKRSSSNVITLVNIRANQIGLPK